MDSLKRRMFQDGGAVQQNILGRGSGFRAYRPTEKGFVEEDGNVFYREVDDSGRILVNDVVNLNLSATRNPQEAYNIQKRNEGLEFAGNILSNAPLVIGGGGLGLAGLKGLLATKTGKKVKDSIFNFLFKKEPRETGAGVLNVASPSAGLTPAAKATGLGGVGVVAGTGLRGMQKGEVPLQDELDEVSKSKSKSKLQPMGETLGTKKEEPKGPPVVGFKDQPLVSKVISNPDFNRFLSNLSSSLTATGSFAEGAAQAASDSFEEKLTDVGGFEPLKSSEASSDVDKNNNISSALRSYQTTVDNIGKLEYAKDQIAEGSGLIGLLGALTTEAKTAIGLELNTPFDQIDPRTQAESLIDAIRQQNIRELLGESGRTISNLDREIVANIFGSIKSTTPPSVIRNKLDKVIKNFRLSLGENRDIIVNNAEYFGNVGRGSGVIEANKQLIKQILSVPDFKTMYIPKYDPSADVDMTSSSGPITDIEYVEGT